ncbi:UDP-N-acetylmuramate--L-alanine ligase [Neomicrococcus lactis]|uniref:UDP-N-acetylmuramate--L-alanine ligase n=1 Tax=Neomicrococcus lactis TaxID=732241 RepID=A0A7W8Y9A8_9MICC|nr:UDP-N-acetylmuramate--L-alanine ligase [Neomicrococcus lactis]MBB5597272.1 UDP-N-acetylmuramate--alanine ligase [Neomicrococcus lactis]
MQQQLHVNDLGRTHLLGIGGVGVSAVARLLVARGVKVSGSDAKDLPVLRELNSLGATTHVGYAAENLGDADTVVISSIIKPGNPEYDEAVRRGLRIVHRSEALSAVMNGYFTVTVAGTHGKTTTSSMIAVMFREAGLSPSFAIGANVAGIGKNAELGEGRVFVAEADESDASFLNYRPDVVVITNIEADHLDHYGTKEAVYEAFHLFASLLPEDGLLVCCADDPGSMALARRIRKEREDIRVQTYGFDDAADRRITDVRTEGSTVTATLEWGSGESVELRLPVPGNHNLLNATAAFAVGVDAGLEADVAARSLGQFHGSARRFESKGDARGVRVFDDYAHHPTEVLAALKAARTVAGEGKVHVVFQPHLFSRTREFSQEFAEALSLADTAYVLDIYPAREEPIPGVTSELIVNALETSGGAVAFDDAAKQVASVAQEGDIIMTVGAGDVTELGAKIVEALNV